MISFLVGFCKVTQKQLFPNIIEQMLFYEPYDKLIRNWQSYLQHIGV